jgi:hypothetical protein
MESHPDDIVADIQPSVNYPDDATSSKKIDKFRGDVGLISRLHYRKRQLNK